MECLFEGRMPPGGGYQDDDSMGFDQLKAAGEILVAPQKTQEAKQHQVDETQGRIDTLAGETAKRQKEIDGFNLEIANLKSKLAELKTAEKHYKDISKGV
jgi:peptidoglycan hydrolase CwlO-like protein